MKINDLSDYLDQLLRPEQFNDYCPNGLQVEGKREISKIVTGVTASMDLLQAAHKANADAILVHHGYFWRGEAQPIVGIKKRRLQFLLQHDINLFTFHLPLDVHPEFGNNVMFAKQLGLELTGRAGENDMLGLAELGAPQSLQALVTHIQAKLKRAPQVIGDLTRPIKRIALCTGAAQGYIEQAAAANVDVYISGEISEQTVHVARETGVAYIAAGHHATERYGIRALGEHLEKMFGIAHEFIDVDNPV
ncbi:MAG TPA: Nif3-like dinuclear metal center hexameric protein [Methylotenera sp.]|nr:Nif3-like dinuclear metal center hexameric protein [Methylotenera sp.]HPV44748.1 Nif3-like dinuclear metal center hexameric protein [Methylotenera sp.]